MTITREARILQEFESAFSVSNQVHKSFIKQYKEIQTISRVLYQYERKRRTKKRGEKDRFARGFAELDRYKMEVIRELELEREIMAIRVPEIKDSDVLIHGRVMNNYSRGSEGITVSLVDAENKPVRRLSAKTTDSGYYSIILDTDTLKKVPEEVYLNVSTKEGKVLHKNPEPLALNKGKEFLVEMSLDSKNMKEREVKKKQTDTGKEKEDKEVRHKDLTIIKGIGKILRDKLFNAGITDIQKFVEADEVKLKEVLKNISIKNIKKMKMNARNMIKNE